MNTLTYLDAGVSQERADRAKAAIKRIVQSTFTEAVVKEVGLFSGFFALDARAYAQPVLVSSVDGVGTKVLIAELMQDFSTIGVDLVNHCVNDIAVCGADPLFFLDYLASDRLDVDKIQAVLEGMAEACRQAGCALIGGETAEMPGVYRPAALDLVGAIVGVVDRTRIIDGSKIRAGDRLLGVPSNGLHTNGYSLVRKVLLDQGAYKPDAYIESLGRTLGQELLEPHRSYLTLIAKLRVLPGVHGLAHITGGGILGNVIRLLPGGLRVRVRWGTWPVPPIFGLIQSTGGVPEHEMRSVFNLGVGLVVVVGPAGIDAVKAVAEEEGLALYDIGEVVHQDNDD